jgi:hypothetical protein
MISAYAEEPVPLNTQVCLVFREPKLIISGPLTCDAIFNLSKGDSDHTADIIHGLYLRYEQDAQNVRIRHFNSGDILCLQRDVGQELRVVLKLWANLWKKEASKWIDTGDEWFNGPDEWSIDFVHLQWFSRIAKGLSNELFSLGTAQRRQDYIKSIMDRRVEIPNM